MVPESCVILQGSDELVNFTGRFLLQLADVRRGEWKLSQQIGGLLVRHGVSRIRIDVMYERHGRIGASVECVFHCLTYGISSGGHCYMASALAADAT
jgi:hypothetical protein